MALIRLILGKLILLLDWVFTPRSITRDPAQQALIDGQTASLTLYQYQACPFLREGETGHETPGAED